EWDREVAGARRQAPRRGLRATFAFTGRFVDTQTDTPQRWTQGESVGRQWTETLEISSIGIRRGPPTFAYRQFVISRSSVQVRRTEVFAMLCLSTKHRVIAYHEVSRGTLNSTLVHPREVSKAAHERRRDRREPESSFGRPIFDD